MLMITKYIILRINFFNDKSKSKSLFVLPLSIKSHPTYPYV